MLLVYKTHLGGYEARIGEQNHGTQNNQLNLQDQLNGQSAVIQTLLDGKLRTGFFVWTQYKENRIRHDAYGQKSPLVSQCPIFTLA